jgi:hypothetical protein
MNVRSNPLMRSANTIKIDCHDLPIIFVAMDPYAKRNERRVGASRPKISHLPANGDPRSRKDRQREKQAVAAERRAIKKAARQELKQKLRDELSEKL